MGQYSTSLFLQGPLCELLAVRASIRYFLGKTVARSRSISQLSHSTVSTFEILMTLRKCRIAERQTERDESGIALLRLKEMPPSRLLVCSSLGVVTCSVCC